MNFIHNGIFLLLVGFAAALSCLFSGCASQSEHYTAKVLHHDKRLTAEQFSAQSIVVFPLITKNGFDTTETISAKMIGRIFRENRNDIRIFFKNDFEKKYLSSMSYDSLKAFYRSLFEGDIIKIQTSDSVWSSMPAAYLLTVRLCNWARIKDWEGVIQRKISLEIELWSTEKGHVVWRATVEGFEPDIKSPDADFILKAVKSAFNLLPGYRPSFHESEW